MSIFNKNVKKILPYDRGQYIEFLSDDFDADIIWYGLSFNINNINILKKLDLNKIAESYSDLIISIIEILDDGNSWIVNHDDKDLVWFPNEENNLNSLRNLFRRNHIKNSFRGALVLTKNDLLEISKDLILYPYAILHKDNLLYKNLDISHEKLQFIIKISGHLTVDILSTNKDLLRKVIRESSTLVFVKKAYRGTVL